MKMSYFPKPEYLSYLELQNNLKRQSYYRNLLSNQLQHKRVTHLEDEESNEILSAAPLSTQYTCVKNCLCKF